MALNPKHLLFVKEYLVDKNATRAAKVAGFSPKTAYAQGHRLLKSAEVAAAIEKGIAKQMRSAELRALTKGMSKERWIEELCIIAGANIDDFVTIDKETVKNGSRGSSYEVTHVNAVATAERDPLLGRAVKKISETKNGIGIELHSKQAALETLGKHFGWISNDMNLNVPTTGVQVILTMPANGREATTQGVDNNGNQPNEVGTSGGVPSSETSDGGSSTT